MRECNLYYLLKFALPVDYSLKKCNFEGKLLLHSNTILNCIPIMCGIYSIAKYNVLSLSRYYLTVYT